MTYSGGSQVKNQGNYFDVRPPVSEYESIKEMLRTGYGGSYITLIANWDKIYWFAPLVPTSADKGSVMSLEAKFNYFENQYLNEKSLVPWDPVAIKKTKSIQQTNGLREIYQSDNTIVTVNGKSINIATTFNLSAGTTGKQFYKSVMERFINQWAIFNPKYSITQYYAPNVVATTTVAPPAKQAEPDVQAQAGGSNTYMKYIQYTLQQMDYSIKLTGIFDSATHNAVVKFQNDKKLNPFREYGIVDSETKSAFATFWLNLAKNNTARFDKLRKDGLQYQIVKFIDAAIQYSDISNICNSSSSSDYKRISYTGTAGPTSIEDSIYIEVPQVLDAKTGQPMAWQELNSIKIQAGSWPVIIKDISLYTTDLVASTFNPAGPAGGDMFFQLGSGKLLGSNESKEIPLNGKRGIKYVRVHVVGQKINLPGTKVAEGFSIADIKFSVVTPTPGKDATEDKSGLFGVNADAVGRGVMFGTTTVESGDFGIFKLGTIADAIGYPNSTIDLVQLTNIDIDVVAMDKDGNPKLDLDGNTVTDNYNFNPANQTLYSSGDWNSLDEIKFNVDELNFTVESITGSTVMGGVSPFIHAVNKKSATATTALSALEISQQFEILNNRAPIYQVITTNGIEIISKEYLVEYDVIDFYLADADVNSITQKQNIKKSVNAKDGAVILLNQDNKPSGFPDYSKFDQPDVDISFGVTMLKWNLKDSNGVLMPAPEGLQWGFYNIRTKEFLGKKIDYQYLGSNKRDVFIGVLAFDADGDAKTTDNILGTNDRVGTLAQFQFPAKSICPVYSVRVSDRAKIAVSSPPNYLSKFDTWFINVSRGRFYKQLEIPVNYNFIDWKKNYKGVTLRCFYDTTRIPIPSSGLFGSGYYDIFEENPIVISQNEIQLRHGSVNVAQEQLDKSNSSGQYTDASPIQPWIEIFVQDSDFNWNEISPNQIRNFNKHNGTISFANEIVPSNEKKIKVSYTVKNPNIMMYHVDGREIPLNPYSLISGNAFNNTNSQAILESYRVTNMGAPVYFYILPLEVEELVNGEYIMVSDYSLNGSPVKFTTDYSIFSISSTQYNPFAIHLGTAMINGRYSMDNVNLLDLRVKGGGISANCDLQSAIEGNSNVLSFSDIYSGKGYLYANGGYVIVKIPKEVKANFASIDQVYAIVRANLTAGVAFDIQDMDGNDWRTI
jgi:peptidoglycan hydrolase-like protein with peptidoglycan-binding domain